MCEIGSILKVWCSNPGAFKWSFADSAVKITTPSSFRRRSKSIVGEGCVLEGPQSSWSAWYSLWVSVQYIRGLRLSFLLIWNGIRSAMLSETKRSALVQNSLSLSLQMTYVKVSISVPYVEVPLQTPPSVSATKSRVQVERNTKNS